MTIVRFISGVRSISYQLSLQMLKSLVAVVITLEDEKDLPP